MSEDSKLRAEPGLATGKVFNTSPQGDTSWGPVCRQPGQFPLPLPARPWSPELAEFQQACQITWHGGDWICPTVGPDTHHDHTRLHRQLNGPEQKQCKVLRVIECALPKTDTGLFAVPENKRPRDCRQGTFSWSLSTLQLDKTMRKQESPGSPAGPADPAQSLLCTSNRFWSAYLPVTHREARGTQPRWQPLAPAHAPTKPWLYTAQPCWPGKGTNTHGDF